MAMGWGRGGFGRQIKLDACIALEDVACRAAWKRREVEGTDMPVATTHVEINFVGPEDGAKRRRVDGPKYLCSRNLCVGCCVGVIF